MTLTDYLAAFDRRRGPSFTNLQSGSVVDTARSQNFLSRI